MRPLTRGPQVGARLLSEPLDRAFKASVVAQLPGRERRAWKTSTRGGEDDGLQGLGGLNLRDMDLVLLELDAASKVGEDVALRLAKMEVLRELLDDGVEDGAIRLAGNEEVIHVGVDHAHQLAVDVEAIGALLEAGLEEAGLLEVLPKGACTNADRRPSCRRWRRSRSQVLLVLGREEVACGATLAPGFC